MTSGVERISENNFISVIRKRDIQKARIMSAKERKKLEHGELDVHLESPLGEERTISRQELMEKYVYLSGKRIKISGWKANKDYYVVREDNTEALAIQIPTKYRIRVGNRVTNSKKGSKGGDYIVCLKGEDNELDRERASIVSRELFRKMFTIQKEEYKRYCKNRGYVRKSKVNKVKAVQNKQASYENTQIKKEEVLNIPKAKPMEVPKKAPIEKKEESERSGYTVVGKVVNREDKILGFIIRDGRGNKKQVTKQEIIGLCSRKLVSNISLAIREGTGTKYLRGNGIKISELPKTVI